MSKLDEMKDGFVSADELWTLLDSRASLSMRNRVSSSIVLKSRKRDLNYSFTCQLLDQLDRRIRKVVDFTSYPILNARETVCKVVVFRTGYPNSGTYMKTFYYKTGLVFKLYDTTEEISMMDSSKNSKPVCIFQIDKDSKPQVFDDWDACEKVADEWWQKNAKDLLKQVM